MKARQELIQSAQIRASYKRLPFQGIWTWLTGKELPNRKPLWKSSSIESLFWSLTWLLGGITASLYIIENQLNYFYLIVSTIFSVSGARYIVATIIHQAVHYSLFKSPAANKWISEILSTILIVQPFDSYKKFHIDEHHQDSFSTVDDKDLAALYKLGFKPKVTVKQMKKNLLFTCLSPVFHVKYFMGRIKSNLINVPKYRLMMTLLWFTSLTVLAMKLGVISFLIVFAIPMVIIYQICSLLHLLTEHVWIIRNENTTVEQSHINNCLARFCGQHTPEKSKNIILNVWNWSVWISAHLFYHLPVRMLVLQGTLIVHDWHHRFGGHPDWSNTIQLREADVQKLKADDVYDYTEVWEFDKVINYVLSTISESDEDVDISQYDYRLN